MVKQEKINSINSMKGEKSTSYELMTHCRKYIGACRKSSYYHYKEDTVGFRE